MWKQTSTRPTMGYLDKYLRIESVNGNTADDKIFEHRVKYARSTPVTQKVNTLVLSLGTETCYGEMSSVVC